MHGSMSAYQDRAMIQGVHVTLSRLNILLIQLSCRLEFIIYINFI